MTQNKQQTAVEWLAEQIECFGNKHELQMSWTTLDELYQQAKEMEKERMIEFAQSYAVIHCMGDITKNADEYYKETYGGKNEQHS
jgi:hypothetical protein